MAKTNYYYDTRNNNVYTSDETFKLDIETRRHLARVPFNGTIEGKKYIKEELDTNDMIKMVNRHHDEISREIPSRPYGNEARKQMIENAKREMASRSSHSRLEGVNTERAYRKSTLGKPHKDNRKKEKISAKTVALALAAIIAVGSFTAVVVDKISDAALINSTDKSISILTYDENDKKYIDETYNNNRFYSIVSQNTHRTSDNQNYWYNNSAIASDLLKLPSYAIHMGLFQIYMDMRENAYNPGHANIDEVIEYLSDRTKDNEELKSVFEGCKTFDDYLIKNGFFLLEGDKKVANKDLFFEYQKESLKTFEDKLSEDANAHIEELYNRGGR